MQQIKNRKKDWQVKWITLIVSLQCNVLLGNIGPGIHENTANTEFAWMVAFMSIALSSGTKAIHIRSMEAPLCLLTSRCQEVLCPCLKGPKPCLIHSDASMNRISSGTPHSRSSGYGIQIIWRQSWCFELFLTFCVLLRWGSHCHWGSRA